MAIKPKLGEYTADENLGTGALQSSFDYLKTSDPTAYYYNKLKSEGNEFLRDDMWNEAIRRGEVGTLVSLLQERRKYGRGEEYNKKYNRRYGVEAKSAEYLDEKGIDMLSKWESYGNYADYDGYMLALSVPTLDDTVKKQRVADNGYVFGNYTDKEWAIQILDNQFQQYDNAIIEEDKKIKNAWDAIKSGGAGFVSIGGNVLVGVSEFVIDIFNIFEGLINMGVNWSDDDNVGSRFLWAFQNDPENPLREGLNEFHRYNRVFGAEVVTASGEVTTFGKYWDGISESIGYMLPSILLTYGTTSWAGALGASAKVAGTIGKVAGQTAFYAGIFSGNIKDTVTAASKNGISYKDLNAGNVVGNAALKAVAQWAVEKTLAGIIGASGLDKLIGITGKVADDAAKIAGQAKATGLKAAGIVAGRAAKDALKEGLEEALQDLSDGLIDTAFGKYGSELNELYLSRGMETISIQNLVDSFVMGALTSIMVGSFQGTFTSRAVMTDADGKTYKAGLFQSLNFKNALATMNEWNNTLNDNNAKLEARQEAALNISKAYSLLGSFVNQIGVDRAIRANNMLNQMINKQAAEARIDSWLKDGYAKNLYNNFVQAYDKLVKEHDAGKNAAEKNSLFDKVKKALSNNNLIEKLKKKLVTTAKNFVTKKSTTEETNLSEDSLTKLKKVAEGLGVEMIISTDGSIVTKAEGIAFVDNKLVENGDVESIIQGMIYDKVESAFIESLSDDQKEFLTEQYSKIVPSEVTLEAAVQALVFDKQFYTKLLLLSSDTKLNNNAIAMLSKVIDIVKTIKNDGNIDESATNALLEKVLNTMRTGLVSYATKYVYYNIDTISDEILPKDFKEAIKNHQNTILTKFIKDNIDSGKITTQNDAERYDQKIDQFRNNLSDDEVKQLKQDVRSADKLKRAQAWYVLAANIKFTNNINNEYGSNKLVFLSPVEDGIKLVREQFIKNIEDLFGTSFDNIRKGEVDPNELSETIVAKILSKDSEGYQRYRLDSEYGRFELVRDTLLELSNNQYTIDSNYNILQVLQKESFLKKKYLEDKSLIELFKSKDVVKVKDIIKSDIKTSKTFLDIEIRYSPTAKSSSYGDGNNYITVGKSNIASSIMHELTHVTQYLIIQSDPKAEDITAGGSTAIFKNIKPEVKQELETFMNTNFPILSKIVNSQFSNSTFKEVIYYILEGELQANASLSSLLSVIGFTYRNNYKTLVAPNGKTFDLIIAKSKESKTQAAITDFKEKAEEKKKSEVQSVTEGFKEILPEKDTKKKTVKEMDPLQYGVLDEELNKTRPIDTSEKDIKDKYNVDAKEARDYVLKITGYKYSDVAGDFSKVIKEAEAINLSKTSKESVKKFKAGIEYMKARNEYTKKLSDWLAKSETKQKEHINMDRPLSESEEKNLKNIPVIKSFLEKGSSKGQLALVDDYGNPMVIYRGAGLKIKAKNNKIRTGKIFTSTKAFVGQYYSDPEGMIRKMLNKVESKINKDMFFEAANEILSITPGDQINNVTTIISDILDVFVKYKNEKSSFKNAVDFYTKRQLALKPLVKKLSPIISENIFRGYICNLTIEEIYYYDAGGNSWSNLEYKGNKYNTDKLVDAIAKDNPEIKAVVIRDVNEGQNETNGYGTDVIILDPSRLMRVTKEDSEAFIKAWRMVEDDFINYSVAKENGLSDAVNYTITDFGTFEFTNVKQEDLFNEFTKQYIEYYSETENQHISEDILIKGKTIEEKDTKTNIDSAKAFNKVLGKTRYVPNKRANLSNLKYFVKKGVPIQMHPGVADFIEGTTANFDKLPNVLKDEIKAGTLNKYDILDYLATANNIDDYTFKAIAKNIFNNTEVEKITYKDMKKLLEHLLDISQYFYLLERNSPEQLKSMSPNDLLKTATEYSSKQDYEKIKSAAYKASSLKVLDENGKLKPVEAFADPKQLQIAFFRIYDGSAKSIRDLNNYGKVIDYMQSLVSENNWKNAAKYANQIYQYDEVKEIISDLSREYKIEAIKEYRRNIITARILERKLTPNQARSVFEKLQDGFIDLEKGSDKAIDIEYLTVVGNEGRTKTIDKPIEYVRIPYEQQAPSKKNIKDQLRNLGRTITKRIAGLKSRYNLLSDEVKKYIDSKTYTLNDKYRSLSTNELNTLLPKLQDAAKTLRSRITKSEIESRIQAEVEKRIAKLTKNMKGPDNIKTKTTIKEKIEIRKVTKIVNQEYVVTSTVDLTTNDDPNVMTSDKLVHSLLDTNWEKYSDSEVQGVDTKDAKSVAAIRDFLVQNTDTILSADLKTTEEAARWFLNTKLQNASDEDFRQFNIIKQYFLELINTETKSGKLYENMNANLKQQIDNWVEKNASLGGTTLAIHNNMLQIRDPLKVMKSADMILDGVEIKGELKDKLFSAIETIDITKINEAMREVRQYVEENKTAKKSFLQKAVTVRSMSMLSSPMTWLRNRVSNFMLKRLNKLSSYLGNRIFKSKTKEGQLKLTGKITPEIQKFIVDNFVDNKFFDTIVSNISKYNPSDITAMKQNDTGSAVKEQLLAQLVIKAMYNEYYNANMFKSKIVSSTYNLLMKAMSDDNYVREAAIRYFGKLLAENNRTLDQGITDDIMNDFAKALGLALNDYMHSENFFNKWEGILAERSEIGWFVYKNIMPFAASSWNWFKAMIKMSPLGLGRSIVKIWRLENNVKKAEQLWQEGKTQVSPELTEYIIRRELGQGVIGTIGYILGIALAAIGFIQLDDDDYGNPKLTIGSVKIDISSIFGSSSILAGAAFVTGIKDEGSFNEALNRTLDVMLDNFPVMQILELDMYSNGSWDIIANTAESIALSYIPNFLSYLAGATYSGNVKKDTFWRRAAAKIPFLGNFLPKKVDPYTGSKGSYIDALNRIIPYFSLKVASDNEKKTTELGLNKTMLRGQYSINGKEFNVKGKDLDTINKLYGQWNANDLTKFYDNKMKVEVKVGNTYKLMSYNQMDDKQRKSAVQTIMSNNAELAKIYAWTVNGNKYYASETIYVKLKKYGISKNVYRGSQGFVKKK